MIRNQFIYETNFEFDSQLLNNSLAIKQHNNGLRYFQYPHNLTDYTKQIKEQFVFLSPVFNVYKSIPNLVGPIHIDSHRSAALNIPIYGTENSSTIFYKHMSNLDMIYNPLQFYHLIRSQVDECFRFTLSRPTFINTTYPHSVINGPTPRAILSWSVNPEYTFEDIIQLLDDYT